MILSMTMITSREVSVECPLITPYDEMLQQGFARDQLTMALRGLL